MTHSCRPDHRTGQRLTRQHLDDCTTSCAGCNPCTKPHCTTCGWRHLDHDHPLTCPTCIGDTRRDLDDIRWLARHLRWHATRAGRDGRLTAAAPIPGGDALVLLARAGADRDDLWWSKHLDDDHHGDDVVPVLLPLLTWEHQWRAAHGHAARADHRSPVTAITNYFADHLTDMAQTTDGPDFPRFADDMAALRRQLERVLHDEREPEQGVECFDCGHRLVRRFGQPTPCRHTTPARAAVAQATRLVSLGYPELAPTTTELREARVPCGRCDQGGIADPSAGQSWECPGCRKQYTPGEYAHAVRRDLLERGPDGDGWTHITMAAEAATTLTGRFVPPTTVRKWMDRGRVASVCRWSPGVAWGQRLVFWPDVADLATAPRRRAAS